MTQPDEFESALEALPIRLENVNFEGPLDLLLHLIKKNEVNIYDIPIAAITEQYLSFIKLMEELNLDVAGEFLVMAATLIHIKSKMLLPRPETAATVEGEEEDPRVWTSDPIVEGDRASISWWASLVEDGADATLAGTSILRFDADGLVVEQWDAWNQLALRRDPPGWSPFLTHDT